MISMFVFEGWVKQDQNQIQAAIAVQQQYVLKKYSLKDVTHKIEQMTEEERVSQSEQLHEMIMEMEKLRKELRDLLASQTAFDMMNKDKEVLSYQIDFHGGLRKIDAEEVFNEQYYNILGKLRSGVIEGNTKFPRQHIIKVITGYGHHHKEDDPNKKGRLKQHFVEYFKRNMFDFAYSQDNGVFLIRVKY